jgi:hypothetical protein
VVDDALTLLAQARSAGLAVAVAGDRLVVRGPRAGEAVARRLLARGRDVAAAVAAEAGAIAWRVEVLRPRVPAQGAIPFLVVRDGDPAPGCCLSCGEPLQPGARYRCLACVKAVEAVLNALREEAT